MKKKYFFKLSMLPVFILFVLNSGLLAQDLNSIPKDTLYELTFKSGNLIKGKIIEEDVNRLRVVYLQDTITLMRNGLQSIGQIRMLGDLELVTIIFPKNHPQYGEEIARDAIKTPVIIESPNDLLDQEPLKPTLYELELKTGSILVGQLIQETTELVIFKVGENELRIKTKDVRSLRIISWNSDTGLRPQLMQGKYNFNHYSMSYTPTAFNYEPGRKVYEGVIGLVDGVPIIWNTLSGSLGDHFSGGIGLAFPGVITGQIKGVVGEGVVRGGLGWETFIIPFDGIYMVNNVRGMMTIGQPEAFANFSYSRFLNQDVDSDAMISLGGGFQLAESLFVNVEWLIIRDNYDGYSDTFHLVLPRISYQSRTHRFGLTPSLIPDSDTSVVLFLTYAHLFGKGV